MFSRSSIAGAITTLGFVVLCVCGAPLIAADAKNGATGTVVYKGTTVVIRYAWLVRGPDAVDPKKVIRRVVLSPTDIGEKIRSCAKMSCSDGDLREGMTVDFDAGPRLNYWVVMNDQRVQYSGTARAETFTVRADGPGKIAGRLSIDDSRAGGAVVEVDFDAALVKEFSK
jgi:hypothetical protein